MTAREGQGHNNRPCDTGSAQHRITPSNATQKSPNAVPWAQPGLGPPELQRGDAAGTQSPQLCPLITSGFVAPAPPGTARPRDHSRKPTGGSEKPKTSQPRSKPSIQALGVAAKGGYLMGFPKFQPQDDPR